VLHKATSPTLGRHDNRFGTVTHTRLHASARRTANLLQPTGRRSIVVFLDPGPDGRGDEVTLFESDWDELEPDERSDG
jgi:hypothetical protein